MTSNLKYSLSANSTRIGVNHSTNETFEFNTGTACGGNEACIMNGNTVMSEPITNSGYHYSWYAATAGTGTSSTVGETAGSICPKGWRLPANYTISSTKSFGGITDAYLGFHTNTTGEYVTIIEATPLNFVLAGDYHNGTFIGDGDRSLGNCWTSTASEAEKGYNLYYEAGYFGTSYMYPQNTFSKNDGYSIRCVNTDL